MSESIKQRVGAMSDIRSADELLKVLNTLLVDVTAQRTAIVTLTAKIDVLTAKLNADVGVTDANYAIDFATACNPAALTTLA